jgi:hypothetical protein
LKSDIHRYLSFIYVPKIVIRKRRPRMVKDTKVSKEAIKACQLKPADVLLIHTKRSLWSWIIRLGTHSYWNHALIVCDVKTPEQSYQNTIVVDPKTDGSIEMGCASKYLGRLNKYNVAVKRLEAAWFQDDGQSDVTSIRSCICHIAVNEVASKSGSRLVELVNRTIRQLTVIYRFVRRKIRGSKAPLHLPWNIRPLQMRALTCSGFVQWCYYKGVSQIVKERHGDRTRLQEVIFNPRVKKKVTPFELLTTTPADLASCAKLSWKYIIMDGVIREVTGREEANLVAVTGAGI